ncbi:MAG TPA: hypothetical protein PK014_05160, partial [Thermoanaerobaculia bacterium]|nr:hypothetical protein [Thermoanaerobaculia bacterium]HXK67962.1 hypothetical protein [Thermoanaerobaculia bacterium]
IYRISTKEKPTPLGVGIVTVQGRRRWLDGGWRIKMAVLLMVGEWVDGLDGMMGFRDDGF